MPSSFSLFLSPPEPCAHLAEFLVQNGPHPFQSLQDCIITGPLGRASLRPTSAHYHYKCHVLNCLTPPHRLYACVSCATLTCHVHGGAHSDTHPGHVISVDIDRAELFCLRCLDLVYHPLFDSAVISASASSTEFLSPPPPPEKRRRVEYRKWDPVPLDRHVIALNSTPLTNESNHNHSNDDDNENMGPHPYGLRGLNNLGSTCFMNSVLQALLHTPPFRNYFLSDRHNRFFCQRLNSSIIFGNGNGGRRRNEGSKSKKKNSSNNSDSSGSNVLCLACDMDALFSAVFSGDRTPFSPAKLLYSWWQHAANLATYEQQDAHEFFISMLDGIHEKVAKDQTKPQIQGHFHRWWETSRLLYFPEKN